MDSVPRAPAPILGSRAVLALAKGLGSAPPGHPRSRVSHLPAGFASPVWRRSHGEGPFPRRASSRPNCIDGGLLKTHNSILLPTNVFQTGDPPVEREFVRLRKGERWLVHAVCGPMRRQCGLSRTSMVESLITAAVAAFNDQAVEALCGAIGDARPPA